jgi:hypothetical protein
MKLPNVGRALIEPAKLQRYLLSRAHPVGRFKVPFFSALGYSDEDWSRLEVDLRGQHLSQDATAVVETSYGRKYVIRARLVGPNGNEAEVASVWIVRANEDFPRFVTAYPGGGG